MKKYHRLEDRAAKFWTSVSGLFFTCVLILASAMAACESGFN